jgi:hypothetical protein
VPDDFFRGRRIYLDGINGDEAAHSENEYGDRTRKPKQKELEKSAHTPSTG